MRRAALKKGDVLAVARVAAIMAVKRTADLIPLCHSGVPVEGVSAHVEPVDGDPPTASGTELHLSASEDDIPSEHLSHPLPPHGGVRIAVRVQTTAKTGIEMEALAGVVGAALTVVDMCKGVDRGLEIGGVRVAWKRGGRSGGFGGV